MAYPQVLYEDNHLIAINKRVSDIVQGDWTGDTSLDNIVKAYLKEKYNKHGNVFLGVIHRLDRPVSGVVLFARTGKALSRMNEQFKLHETEKIYWAVVKNQPPEDEGYLVHYMIRNREKNKSFVYSRERAGSKRAELIYRVVGRSEKYWFLEIRLLTGRHHQIRAQLAAIGSPIRGDLKYGYPRSDPGGGIHLHARELHFNHPVGGQKINIIADPPKDKLWSTFLSVCS
ncbi:MAG TPA: RluA family pseudouridine synthase [Bacteroidetes bacterium]|nr:RluA family pseudouridine synthase [Bacteroidota bacterium]